MTTCQRCQTLLAPAAAFCSRCGEAAPVSGADLPLSNVVALASRKLVDGEVDQAIELLEPHALMEDPEPGACFALAAAYMQRGRYSDALPLLLDVVSLQDDDARARAYLAMAYLHTYQVAEARESMDLAVQLAPDDFVVNLKHGELLVRLGYFRESIPVLDHALRSRAPDAATLDFARRLLLLARQKAPNTFSRPVNQFPLSALVRGLRRHFGRGDPDPAPSPACADP
jgi:tetratricopeptide (TPR) repeat protein